LAKDILSIQVQDGNIIRKYERIRRKLINGEAGFCEFHVHMNGKTCGRKAEKAEKAKKRKKLKKAEGGKSRRKTDKKERSNGDYKLIPNEVLEANEIARRLLEEAAIKQEV
jgi:hypothetical protein